MNEFNIKVKKVVKNNFKISVDKYFEFENKYNFFYNLTVALGKFMNIEAKDRVLDIGCGYGVSSKALIDTFQCSVIGIDLSDEMIAFGKNLYPDIDITVGDGENLDIFKNVKFDKIIYNAAIFIFPDTFNAFKNAYNILEKGGEIGFSHYPEIYSESGKDLFNLAFEKANLEIPKRKVISTVEVCINNLQKANFNEIKETEFILDLDIEFLKNFFQIPAQSASLFPKLPYEKRAAKVNILFDTLKKDKGLIKWKLVKAKK